MDQLFIRYLITTIGIIRNLLFFLLKIYF